MGKTRGSRVEVASAEANIPVLPDAVKQIGTANQELGRIADTIRRDGKIKSDHRSILYASVVVALVAVPCVLALMFTHNPNQIVAVIIVVAVAVCAALWLGFRPPRPLQKTMSASIGARVAEHIAVVSPRSPQPLSFGNENMNLDGPVNTISSPRSPPRPPDEVLIAAGLRAFYPSRDFYNSHRANAHSIDKYVATASKTLVMVSVNLMTGLPFDGLCRVLASRLENRAVPLSAVISLLDFRSEYLMQSMSSVFGWPPEELKLSIFRALGELLKFRSHLSSTAQSRLDLRVHKSIPFGSAILLDHREPNGRIQIESKPYKVPVRQSFAFEIGPHGTSGLYEAMVDGFQSLLADGEACDLSWVESV
jgi:hypothetical protein